MKSSSKIGILRTLENEFAAAAMTEGNLEMAREFLREQESLASNEAASPTVSKVRNFVNGFEQHFAAAAMAEGNVEMAREFLKEELGRQQNSVGSTVVSKLKGFVKSFENVFAAAAMAEGGPEMAREYLQCDVLKNRQASLKTFMQTIGLNNVRFQYRIALV